MEIWRGTPDDDLSEHGGWPTDWVKTIVQRKGKTNKTYTDSHWFSPSGKKYRSMAQVKKALAESTTPKNIPVVSAELKVSEQTQSMASKKKSKKANPKAAANADQKAPANASEVDQQMQQVLVLLSARTKGRATNEQVEKAVSQILSTAGLGPPQAAFAEPTPPNPAAPSPQPQIEMDTEDYDFEEDDDKKPAAAAAAAPQFTNVVIVPRGSRKRKRPADVLKDKASEDERKKQYEKISLGQQGAHMMTSFGDGSLPVPEAVSAALLGARKLLQVTIQDARALKRKNKQQFEKAQLVMAKHVPRKRGAKSNNNDSPTTDSAKQQATEAIPNPEMLYRAFIGYDKMARETQCGFNYEQLKGLFPEEMRAYSRWNQLKDEYQKNQDEKESAVAAVEEAQGETGEDDKEDNLPMDDDPVKDGGHLLERAVQFDVRTNLMDQGWYMKFSEHRKGSFLPRKMQDKGDREWEENRKNSKGSARGANNHKSKENGIWAQMSAKSARFLHWVGFDPDKGLPPPNDETTQALAFLGYDFLGRIVEKAIFLKNLAKAKESVDEVDERTILLELEDGEQLQKDDIDLAMNDIRPAAMYSTTSGFASTQKPVAQLYFGPGFEERVEMELDELMCVNAKRADVSDEEAKIRKEEDKLFAKMAEPPTTNNAVMHLLRKEEKENENKEAEVESKPTPTQNVPKNQESKATPTESLPQKLSPTKEDGKEEGEAGSSSPTPAKTRPEKRIKKAELKAWGGELAG